MANQMIALQSRAPQLPDPSRLTAQYANMMNMVQQNETSKRQAERAQQEIDYATAEETRKKDLHGPALTKAQQDNAVQALEMFRERVGDIAEGDVAAAEAVRADLVARIPGYDKFIPPASQWTRDTIERLMMTSEKEIDKLYATPVASLEVDVSGNPRSVTVGGLNPQQSPVYDAPPPMANAPRATPTAPQAAPANPMASGYKPNTAAAAPGSLSLVINSALETGVMAKADFDKMLSLAPPESRAKIAAWAQQNNIQVTSDVPGVTDNQMRGAPNEMRASPMSYDGQTPESQFAVYRGEPMQSQTAGLRGAPPMEQTLAQTQPRTVTKLQRKDPDMGAYPGSARVPLSRVAGEAAARLEPIERVKARKAAELQVTEDFEEANKDKRLDRKSQEVFAGERAKKDADFLEKYSDTTTKSRTGLNLLDQMIGDARLENGKLVVPKGGRRPHPGFEGVVGMGVPGVRFIPGTQAAGFDALFEQIKGAAFLKAFDDLRGGGSITVTEGDKATAAMTRMNRSQSEIEFVRAAREFRDILRAGIEKADKRYTALTGEAPAAAPARRKTPTKGSDGWGKAKVVGN